MDLPGDTAVTLNRGLRACWGIMGNQGKQIQDGGRALRVMLAKRV